MTPIRETIARAIAVGHGHGEPDLPWHPQGRNHPHARPLWQWHLDDADRALRGIGEAGKVVAPKEPDDAMKAAGYRKIGQTHYEPMASAQGWGEHAADVYRAMIAAGADQEPQPAAEKCSTVDDVRRRAPAAGFYPMLAEPKGRTPFWTVAFLHIGPEGRSWSALHGALWGGDENVAGRWLGPRIVMPGEG